MERIDRDESLLRESARRLIEKHGYEGALIEAARLRDLSSWGTYSHSAHNAVHKMIQTMREEYVA